MANRHGEQQDLLGDTVCDGNESEAVELDDFGNERKYWMSLSGYRRDLLSSLCQKSVRRSDTEAAEFAAFEMTRSGFENNMFDRLVLYCLEDIAAGETAVLQVPKLERIARQHGLESRTATVAAMKAARICAEARPSREAVHADDYFRHAAILRAEYDTDEYDFPVRPEDLDGDRKTPDSQERQLTFVDDSDSDAGIATDDYGDPLGPAATCGGFHFEDMLELLEESIVAEDIERASFASWELSRSGFHEEYWSKIAELGVFYSDDDSLVSSLVAQYEDLATDRWEPGDWEGRLCAIHAAITVIRKGIMGTSLQRGVSALAE